MTSADILACLANVIDPDFQRPLAETGAIHDVRVDGNTIQVFLELVQPIHWVAREINSACASAIAQRYPQAEVEIFVRERGLPDAVRSKSLAGVRNLIAVASGKGGVGKSSVAANLAIVMAQKGASVGLLDADIYGPSQPTMYGMAGEGMKAEKTEDGKIIGYPNERYGVKIASIGFVMQRDQAAILRGPMLAGYFTTLVDQMQWGDLDFLVFDLPPGTGDIQLTLTQKIPLTGAVVITTPQEIALADVRRSIQMFRKVNVEVLGVVENMSFFVPPDNLDRRYYIFGRGGGTAVAKEFDVPFLGEIPIDASVREGSDNGFPVALNPDAGAVYDAFQSVASNIVSQIRKRNAAHTSSPVTITI
ncbi:MAG: Mrp/NBP35 family ATP-binding protein [Ignavibacteria bacterium]|nr:Mrp/NBP35 family ATP-binding protein [Ignavibacteria bacterium]